MFLRSRDKLKITRMLTNSYELVLLVHFTKVNPEKNSRGKIKDEKIIVSDKGIYIGEVKD